MLNNILELCDKEKFSIIQAELRAPLASIFVKDGSREWILKCMTELTPQAIRVVHELQKCNRLTDTFYFLSAQRVLLNLEPSRYSNFIQIFAQYESLVPFVFILDYSLALVAKLPPIPLQEF